MDIVENGVSINLANGINNVDHLSKKFIDVGH
jgi:hypothetical protein